MILLAYLHHMIMTYIDNVNIAHWIDVVLCEWYESFIFENEYNLPICRSIPSHVYSLFCYLYSLCCVCTSSFQIETEWQYLRVSNRTIEHAWKMSMSKGIIMEIFWYTYNYILYIVCTSTFGENAYWTRLSVHMHKYMYEINKWYLGTSAYIIIVHASYYAI